mgnify:CR=1 FL=1|tara:strand:+ start:1118 stop:1480 length:363 start_codon:yes stop_codon:yes gene_type:complete
MDKRRPIGFLPRSPLKHLKLTTWVLIHWIIVFGNLGAFFILLYSGMHPDQVVPWYIALPLCTFIGVISTSRVLDCPLTRLENKLRKDVGLSQIKGFIGHYFLKPYVRMRFKRKQRRNSKE